MTPQPLKDLRAMLRRFSPRQRSIAMTLLIAQDDCDICQSETFWRESFGDDWCVARNLFCGPDNWACEGFPVKCPA